MKLDEWTKIFIKQRDLIKREVINIEQTINGFVVTTKKGEQRTILVEEKLEAEMNEQVKMISCLNTKENVNFLTENWKVFSKQEDLIIIFANPTTNEKWLIKPHHHAKIAEEESLKQGLMAMYDAITSS